MPRRMIAGPITFNAGDLEEPLIERAESADRAATSRIAQRDLERYYYHLRLALYGLRDLHASEWLFIMDTLNGTLTQPQTASLLWASVADAIDPPPDGDGLAAKWQVDGERLVARLRRMTPFEALAVADASERWWNRVGAGIEEDNEQRLRAVGLLA